MAGGGRGGRRNEEQDGRSDGRGGGEEIREPDAVIELWPLGFVFSDWGSAVRGEAEGSG